MAYGRVLALARLCVALALLAWTLAAHRAMAQSFEVEDIVIVGIERVSPQTVLAFVGFGKGDEVDQEVLDATVARLFETGLFRDVFLARDGDALVINVVENPTIKSIRFEGMVNLDEEQVLELLKQQDISPGRIFKRGNAEFIERTIGSFYRQTSRFLSTAEVVTVPLGENQVDLVVAVTEGQQAVVREVRFHGNRVLSDSDLADIMEIKESGFVDSMFDRDVFSRVAFDGDLDRIRREYLGSGYVRFEILSTNVRISPEAGGIEIDIYIAEGAQYRFAEPDFEVAGEVVGAEEAARAVTYAVGEVFSDRLVESSREALLRLMRARGHVFAAVDTQTMPNDDTLEVEVTFALMPDNVAEVRRINFVGNNQTRDLVLRRQLEIVEGETFDLDKLEYSLVRLRRNGYLLDARASETRVGEDQVDLDIEVQEERAGTFVIGAGYSNSSGLSFKVEFDRNNIFGTGNNLLLTGEFEGSNRRLRVEFEEPGITDSGISRQVQVFFNDDRAEGSLESSDINNYGGALIYTIPLDRNWSWDAGVVLERTEIQNASSLMRAAPTMPFDDQSSEYVTKFGDEQDAVRFVAGFGYDSRDRAFDTTEGLQMLVRSETTIPPSDVEYYQVRFHSSYYQPLDEERRNLFYSRVQARYGQEYGNGIYPFYKRFFLTSSHLRGFDASEIGPIGNNDNIGGKFVVNANLELERKVRLFGTEGVRVGLFVDAASILDEASSFDLVNDELRSSFGALVKIRTPVFPFAFSYAVPLRKKEGDALEAFQFRIGF